MEELTGLGNTPIGMNAEVYELLRSNIIDNEVFLNAISIIDTIQLNSNNSIFKVKHIKNTNKYDKIANRYSFLDLQVVISLAKKEEFVFLTTQYNKENRLYLTIFMDKDMQNNHKNHNVKDNSENNLEVLHKDIHELKHKKEELIKHKNSSSSSSIKKWWE